MKTRNQDKANEAGSTSDEDSDHQDAHNSTGLSEYERQRLENIRKNKEAMALFNIHEAKSAVSSIVRTEGKKRTAPSPSVGVKRAKNYEELPRRRSNRLHQIEPESIVAKTKDEEFSKYQELKDHRGARRSGDLSLSEINGHGDDGKFAMIMEALTTFVPEKARMKDAEDEDDDNEEVASAQIKPEPVEETKEVKQEPEDENEKKGIRKYFSSARNNPSPATEDTAKASQPTNGVKSEKQAKEPSLRKKVQALRIRGPWPTVKVCEGRIYCMAIHENRDKILVCGGDIDGNLGFWDLDESQADDYEPELDEEPNIFSYRAHPRTLSSMQYSPTDPTKLFTTSYDGSVRYLDLGKQQFIESYVAASDASDHLGSISITSKGQEYWFADNDGAVTLKDIRTPKDDMVMRKILHEKKVGCVNVNPIHSHLIATSSLDRTMKIWDVRTFGKYKEDEPVAELAEFPHRLSVTSAMWSPDGASIASTSYDDYVRIFNNFDPALPDITNIPEPIKIPHNNKSGRWVTMLRAVWSHQFNWFCIGNMKKSVDIYSRGTGDLMANLRDPSILTTVPAVNAWHPNRVVLASGMANGKMVIWR
ncbi:hypothetical protein BGW38_009103 [Lunasporangiospora selenospora]|uniref:DNA damage-binding protein CMR1 n=1 Tax=Lunasporangiospora selenospora TaxID=979761 RepID=A0A9P6FXB5_9FUNG|nr:hypothetical protein BGW38_009103 [Lunasporangiospora selenospora]